MTPQTSAIHRACFCRQPDICALSLVRTKLLLNIYRHRVAVVRLFQTYIRCILQNGNKFIMSLCEKEWYTYSMKQILFRLAILLIISSASCFARDIFVTPSSRIQTEIAKALPGDTVIFSAGTYKDSSFTILCTNVTVRAETSGSVYLNGHTSIIISGNSVTFSGFQFTFGVINRSAPRVTRDAYSPLVSIIK